MRSTVAALILMSSLGCTFAQEATRALSPALDDAIVSRARDRAIAAASLAKADDSGPRALAGVITLARYGDGPARLAVMRAYNTLAPARQAVSVEEITRYGLDLMAGETPGADNIDGEFVFNIAQIEQSHRLKTFARAFVEAARDDARLREPARLETIMVSVRMAPGACEALGEEAQRLKIERPAADCQKPFIDALIAHAAQAGATGFEPSARRAAEAGVRLLAE